MKILRILLAAATVWMTALSAAPGAMAQVTGADVQMAGAAIMAAGTRASKVKSITKVPSVGVVRLDFIPMIGMRSGQMDEAEYRILASRNAAGVSKLQQALRANPATRAALAQRGISPSQVAGAQISSGGSLRLYIFSR
jgi:hypothetical protein